MNSLNNTLDRYDRLWRESKQLPVLAQFLEQASLPDEQRLAALLELIAIDMEYRWRSDLSPGESSQTDTAKVATASDEDTATDLGGSRPLVEDYARQWPEILKDDEIPTDLVAEEFRIRHRWGDRPTVEDYVDRFGDDTALRKELEATHRELQRDETNDDPPAPAIGPAFATLEDSDASDAAAQAIMFGRYRLIRQLGKGGMGEVYLAEDTQLERRVALKTPHLGQSDALQKRFVNEAKAAATLQHPGLCPVFDTGEIDGQPFITMAYIEGDTLREHWERTEDQSTLETVRIFADIARAMQVAHDAGIVHRDLKPSNVMLNSADQPVVMDFGLAFRESIAEGERITQTGDAFGSPAYMSPEQVEGGAANVEPPSDIYSLGVMLFEALTGRLPFTGTVSSILVKIARDKPPLPSQFRTDIDSELEQLCLQMQSKDPAERPASMTEVAERLEGIAYRLQIETRSVSEGPGQATNSPSLTRRVTIPRRRTPLFVAAALIPIVLLLGLIVFKIMTPHGPVRIEVDEEFADQIKVRVLQGGEVVEIADTESGWFLSLQEGEYEFELGKGGEQFEIEPRRVTVSRGNEAVVSVSFLVGTSIPDSSVPNTPNDASSTRQQADFALSFDGKDDYVQLPFGYDGSHPLTVEGWVTPFTLNTNRIRQMIVADEAAGVHGDRTGLQFGIHNEVDWAKNKAGKWWFAGGVNHPIMVLLRGPRVKLNDPVHFAVQVVPRTGAFEVFINGSSVDDEQRDTPFAQSGRDFRIGLDYKFDAKPGEVVVQEPFKGLIHSIRFSNQLRYNGEFTPQRRFESDEQTLALYRFDEGNGFTLKDSSGNGHGGEIHGAKWKEITAPLQSERLGTNAPRRLNLLADIKYANQEDPETHVWKSGGWSRRKNSWLSDSARDTFLAFSVMPEAERFRVEVELEYVSGNSGIYVNVPVGNPDALFLYNSSLAEDPDGRGAGFSFVDGKLDISTKHAPLQAGKPVSLSIDVDQNGGNVTFVASVDGREVSRWTGDKSRLLPNPETKRSSTPLFGVGTSRSSFLFHRAELIEFPIDRNSTDAAPLPAPAAVDDGYVDLFDGKTFDGWEAEAGGDWSIEDGVLVAQPHQKQPRLVYTKSDFTDVRVRVECKLGEGGNSGLHLRTHFGKGWQDGYEAQITNDQKQRTMTGGIYGLAAVKEQLIEDDTWFTLEFEAKGDRLTVWINGEKTAEAHDATFKSGQISLQASDKTPVWFRKVQVKPLQ